VPIDQPSRAPNGYFSEQTIGALATSVGGAIAIIRVSGSNAFHALDALTAPGTSQTSEPRKMYRARLKSSSNQDLDDALFVCFRDPESYTGEDLVELHVHGGGFTASRILESLLEAGVRQALPGEFSFRAVKNGKMSLNQAQAVADLIAASNDGAVSLALEKLSGTQNQLISALATDLRKLCVLGEVGIDFSDQDVDELSLPTLKKRLTSILSSLTQLHSSFDRGAKLQEGVKVAILGLPNAGKSSFFNALLGEDRSIVSDLPGTTRDIIREKMTLKGPKGSVTLRIEDTAGLRHSQDFVEKKGIERSHAAAKSADLIVFLLDPTAPASLKESLQEWEGLKTAAGCSVSSRTLGVLTKSDLVSDHEIDASIRAFARANIPKWLRTSSVTGKGIAEAATEIAAACSGLVERRPGEVLLTRLDQVTAVSDAITHLNRAAGATEIDLFASDIRQALHSLGPLIGETLADDILGQIFSDFCIGK
jgi:tRNA modification GTPase